MPGPPMSTSNPLRSTRSNNRGRGTRGGLQTANPHARPFSPHRPGTLSPALSSKLPVSQATGQQQQMQVNFGYNQQSNKAKSPEDISKAPAKITGGADNQVNEGCEDFRSEVISLPPGAPRRVSDNTGSGLPTPAGDSTPEVPPATPPHNQSYQWHKEFAALREFASHTCLELKSIGGKLNKLDKIEISTGTLARQMTGVLQRTATLEDSTTQNASAIKTLQEEIQSLRSTIVTQGETIEELKRIKEDFIKVNAEFSDSSDQKVEEFNKLIGIQQKQVDAFHETNQRIQDTILENVTQHMDERLKVWTEAEDHNKLIDRARRNKNNLVIIGLQEDDQAPLKTASDFISSTLGIKDVQVDVAYRLGQPPQEGSSYARPIWMHFVRLADRNKVWREKTVITSEDGQQKIRIQQDLPKQLREVAQLLHRILKVAAAHPKYKSARIQDYKLILNGKEYGPTQLEALPKALRPSTLASQSSETTMAFFTRHSVLSNHHPSPFTFKGVRYANVEHYLAHQRAILSEDIQLTQNALEASDPLVAKSILNHLKKDHVKEWKDKVESILVQGLRQKFKQNDNLMNYLKDTQQLKLGEASRDPIWGIGMSLDDPEVLDSTKWTSTGNLLGRALTKIRQEFSQPTSASPRKQGTNEKNQERKEPSSEQDPKGQAPGPSTPHEKRVKDQGNRGSTVERRTRDQEERVPETTKNGEGRASQEKPKDNQTKKGQVTTTSSGDNRGQRKPQSNTSEETVPETPPTNKEKLRPPNTVEKTGPETTPTNKEKVGPPNHNRQKKPTDKKPAAEKAREKTAAEKAKEKVTSQTNAPKEKKDTTPNNMTKEKKK